MLLRLLVSFQDAKKQLVVELFLRLEVDKAIKHLVNSPSFHLVFKIIVTARFADIWEHVLLVGEEMLLWLSQCTLDQSHQQNLALDNVAKVQVVFVSFHQPSLFTFLLAIRAD